MEMKSNLALQIKKEVLQTYLVKYGITVLLMVL